MSLRGPWHTADSNFCCFARKTGLWCLCYMRQKCHSLPGNTSACVTEDSSGAGRGLFPSRRRRPLLAGKREMSKTARGKFYPTPAVLVAREHVTSWACFTSENECYLLNLKCCSTSRNHWPTSLKYTLWTRLRYFSVYERMRDITELFKGEVSSISCATMTE